MRRRLSLVLIAGFALVLPAAATAQQRTAAQRVTITLMSLNTLQQVKDTPPLKKTNPGDAVEYKDLLLNVGAQFGKKAGKAVAYDEGIITYRGAKKPQTIYGIVTFPGIGTLTYSGPMQDVGHGNTTVPVASGTGAFKGARGRLILGPGETKARNTYVVTIPGGELHVTEGGGVA